MCAKAAVDCGVRYLQLRMKNASRETIIQTGRLIRNITRNSATRFIVNDDLEVAIEVDADGIHLGQDDLSLAEARCRWDKPGKIFGLSTHSMEQAAGGIEDRPDYIGVGPVYPTQTKADAAPALGAEEVGRIMQATPVTAAGIGGINAENLPEILSAGVTNFCVISAVNASPRPAEAIRRLQQIWKSHVF